MSFPPLKALIIRGCARCGTKPAVESSSTHFDETSQFAGFPQAAKRRRQHPSTTLAPAYR
jgi:hypothetical protein